MGEDGCGDQGEDDKMVVTAIFLSFVKTDKIRVTNKGKHPLRPPQI